MVRRLLCWFGYHSPTTKHITAWGMYRRRCFHCEKVIPGWY